MQKVKSAPVAPAAITTTAPEVQAPPAPVVATPKVVMIKVLKLDGKFRGARESWYKELVAHDGKPLADYVAKVTATPPSLPTKGKSAGKAEKPSGWISWFVRNGFLSLPEA